MGAPKGYTAPMREFQRAAARQSWVAALFGAVLLSFPLSSLAAPFQVKNHSPVFFGLLYPSASIPRALTEGDISARADFSYSSIFFQDVNPGWSYIFDMELAQLTFGFRRGFGSFEGGVELPLFYAGGGFLDQAILDNHRMFGFVDYNGQREAPRNRYLYSLVHNGKEWSPALPYAVALGDVTVWLKRELLADGERGGLAAELLLQAPSAITGAGLGNGAWEYGFMLIAQRRFGETELTFNGGAVNPGFIDRGEKIALNPMYVCDGAVEQFLTDRLSAVAQLSYVTSPYGEGAPALFRRAWMGITFGARYVTPGGQPIDISFTEDLTQTAPDFTIGFGFQF